MEDSNTMKNKLHIDTTADPETVFSGAGVFDEDMPGEEEPGEAEHGTEAEAEANKAGATEDDAGAGASADDESANEAGETQEEADTAPPADDPEPDAFAKLSDRMSAAFSDKGDLAGDDAARVLDTLDEARIKKMPAEAQVALRAIPELVKREVARKQAELDKGMAELEAENARLRAEAKQLAQQQAEWAKLIDSPEMKALIAKGSLPTEGDEAPDILTADGLREFATRNVAKGLTEALGPLAQASRRAQKESRWNDYVSGNDLLHDQRNRDRFAEIVTAWREERSVKDADGKVVQLGTVSESEWPRILQQVEAEIIIARDKKRQQQERAAREAAARRVSKPRTTSPKQGNIGLPANFQQMTASQRGQFFHDNPDIYERYKRERGISRR